MVLGGTTVAGGVLLGGDMVMGGVLYGVGYMYVLYCVYFTEWGMVYVYTVKIYY